MPITTGILLFDGAEELDFVGPWEVLAMSAAAPEHAAAAAAGGAERAAEAALGDRVLTLAERDAPVACAKGMRVLPDATLESAPPLDVLLVPGGEGTRRELENRPLLDWIAKAAAGCSWVTSVCTGSVLLAAAGLARGRRVTTHWAYVEPFRKLAEEATVLAGPRFVRDGPLVTAAGVSAGIDMTLWLVGQLHGPEHARLVQRLIQYDPAPPYTAEV